MDPYKEFLYQISKLEYQTPYLMVIWAYPPPLFKRFVAMIIDLPFNESYHNAYYGEMKKICEGFMECYTNSLNGTVKHAHRYSTCLSYDEMMELYNKTCQIHTINHETVVKELMQTKSKREQDQLEEILTLHANYDEKLQLFGERLRKMRKESYILEFAENHFEIAIQRVYEMGEFTRVYTAKMIVERFHCIQVSIEDILGRIKRNSEAFHRRYDDELNRLFDEMYERNKESRNISRWARRSSREVAEIQNKIGIIKEKIETFGNFETTERLSSEIKHWSERLRDFKEIVANVTKIKNALEFAQKQEEIHSRYKSTDLSKRKVTCWNALGEKYKTAVQDLEQKYNIACKTIHTYFRCKDLDIFNLSAPKFRNALFRKINELNGLSSTLS